MSDRTPIDQGLDDAIALATWLRDTERTTGAIGAIANHLAGVLSAGGRVLTCGNGTCNFPQDCMCCPTECTGGGLDAGMTAEPACPAAGG